MTQRRPALNRATKRSRAAARREEQAAIRREAEKLWALAYPGGGTPLPPPPNTLECLRGAREVMAELRRLSAVGFAVCELISFAMEQAEQSRRSDD